MPDSNEEQLKNDITLLDNLIGVEARKPGNAAKLPAAIRIIEKLEPAGGKQVPVFPASYAGATDQMPPVYDLSGITFGEGEDTVRVKNSTAKVQRIVRARQCAIDSPQSQANRMEPAFVEDPELATLVPKGTATIPRKGEEGGSTSIFNLPHRVADFRIRLSSQASAVSQAIKDFGRGNALGLIQSFPTSLIFGFWNSRGEEDQGIKHARILLSRIDATEVVPCRRHSLYSGPYSGKEFGEAVLKRDLTDEENKKLSAEGFSAAPGDSLGGVLVEGEIERLSVLSLSDIGRINCTEAPQPEGQKPTNERTNAARRYLFALAALAEGFTRATGSHRLRSGCELVRAEEKNEKGGLQATELRFELRGAKPDNATEIKSLYFNRSRLIALAHDAKKVLGIADEPVEYTVTADTLMSAVVAADKAAKDLEKLEKELAKALQDAGEAETKAATTDAKPDKNKAEKARKKANELQQKVNDLKAKARPQPATEPPSPEATA